MKKFGYEFPVWNTAKEEIRNLLVARSRSSNPTIAYSDLVAAVGSIHLEPDSYALRMMLGEISTEEDEFGHGMLTVLVVHKEGDQRPGAGFFELAHKLGRTEDDPDRLWIDEFKRVTRYWQTH